MISDKRTISGQIAGVNLSSFLQLIEMEQKTCTIKVFTKKNLGYIYFLNGTLVDANTVSLYEIEALYDILSWKDIVIEVEKNTTNKENHINLPLMHILVESAQFIDEKKTGAQSKKHKDDKTVSTTGMPRRILKNTNFCLEIGVKLLIVVDELAVPFQSTLIGIEHGRHLLLKAPGPFCNIDHELFKVKQVVIKTLYKGTIYAFRSKVMNVILKPSKIMFIEYPNEIEHHELRTHKRFKCNVQTLAEMNNNKRGGVIENISKGGCLCVMEMMSPDMDQELLNNTVAFTCQFPGSSGEVSFLGAIRNSKKTADQIAVGIKFIDSDESEHFKEEINRYIELIENVSENV